MTAVVVRERVVSMRIIAAAVLAMLTMGAEAATPEMRAQNGAVLPMPRIEAMGCMSMEKLLIRYSDSQYRGADPVPPDHPDYPIFDYENRLATEYFERCQRQRDTHSSPTEIFREGFN
jgi:hypothetical protein